jgi:hypothetical protein
VISRKLMLPLTHSRDIGGWINGDSDGNGKVDGADYGLIDSMFKSQGTSLRPATPRVVMPRVRGGGISRL